MAVIAVASSAPACAQALAPSPASRPAQDRASSSEKTIQDYNLQLQHLQQTLGGQARSQGDNDYRIGQEDLLEISVFGAPELSGTARVSASGDVSLPLLGAVRAGGLTPREVESELVERLRQTYMKDPHVSVFVKEMQSHPVSIFGSVKKPGVLQIRGPKTLIEVLCLAEGLADDAGSTVLVTHLSALTSLTFPGAGPPGGQDDAEPIYPNGSLPTQDPQGGLSAMEQINLQELLESGDARLNVLVYPGDSVSVSRAGLIYVVGEVRKPGGFQLKGNEKVSVLQALALAEGFTRTAAKGGARIMRTDEKTDARTEIPVDLKKLLSGKVPDPQLQSRDILFVPNSAGRSAFDRGLETAIAIGSGLAIYRF